MNRHGFVRISCVSPRVAGGQPGGQRRRDRPRPGRLRRQRSRALPRALRHRLHLRRPVRPVVTPGSRRAGRSSRSPRRPRAAPQLVVVGAPIPVGNSLFNCAVAIGDGAILGIVPKQYLPNYKEFYESRWFSPASGTRAGRDRAGRPARALRDRSSVRGESREQADRPARSWWASRSARISGYPSPPARSRRWPGRRSRSTSRPATRRSARAGTGPISSWVSRAVPIAAYAMAGAGPSESTTDVVFGGHCLIAENGRLLAESPRVGDGQPIRRDSYIDHPGCRRRQAAGRPPGHDELRRQPVGLARPFRRLHSRFPKRWRA